MLRPDKDNICAINSSAWYLKEESHSTVNYSMAEGQGIFNAKVIDTEKVLARESDRKLIQE